MALEKCKGAISEALGRELSKRESGIVARRASDLKRKIDLAGNDPTAVNGILKDYGDEAATLANAAKRSAALNYLAFKRQTDWHASVEPEVKNPGEVLMASVRGSLRNFFGAKDSVMSLAQRGMNARSFALLSDLTKGKVADFAFDRANNEAVGGALHDMRNGMSQADAIKKYGKNAADTASILESHREDLRTSLNKAGAWIGKNADAIFRRAHDAVKIAKAGGFTFNSPEARKYWIDSTSKKMDWDKAFDGEFAKASDAERNKTLDGLFTDFASGTHLQEPSSMGAGVGPRNLGKKVSHQRQIVFKSAGDEVAYLNEFGHGNSIAEIVRHELMSGGKDIALMTKFGPNAEATFDKIYQSRLAALKQANDVKGEQQLTKAYNSLKENDWNILKGMAGHPGDNYTARYLGAARTWTNAAAIANSIWSLTGDTVLRASMVAQRSGDSMLGGVFKGYMKNFAGHGMTKEEAAAFAAENGIRFEGITSPINPYEGESLPEGMASKAMAGVLRFGMHNGWVNRERINSMMADSNHYWALGKTAFADMKPTEQGILSQFGIDAKGWDVLRQQEATELKDGQKAFTPSAILKMDLSKFKSLAGNEATEAQLTRARQGLSDSYRNLLGEFADRPTVSPSMANQAFMQFGRGGLRTGTVPGEIYRSAMQLKGFVMNYLRNHLGRELYGYNAEYRSFPQAMADIFKGKNPSAAKGLSKLMVAGALNFYVVNALRDLAMGKTPLDPTDFDIQKHGSLWDTPGFHAALKAWSKQSFGLYGEILMGDSGKPSDSWLESVPEKFIGPEGELVGNIADDATAYVKAMGKKGGPSTKDLGHASQMLFGTAWRNAPGTNIFWTKWATDYYLYNTLSESLNPGYQKRLDDRMKKQGQTYLLDGR